MDLGIHVSHSTNTRRLCTKVLVSDPSKWMGWTALRKANRPARDIVPTCSGDTLSMPSVLFCGLLIFWYWMEGLGDERRERIEPSLCTVRDINSSHWLGRKGSQFRPVPSTNSTRDNPAAILLSPPSVSQWGWFPPLSFNVHFSLLMLGLFDHVFSETWLSPRMQRQCA